MVDKSKLTGKKEGSETMKKIRNILLGSVTAAFLVSIGACEKAKEKVEGTAEKAGSAVGEAVD
jgi:hypothetical protein